MAFVPFKKADAFSENRFANSPLAIVIVVYV